MNYFFSAQFKIDGSSAPFRFDRNDKDGEVLTYILEDIQSLRLFCKPQHYIS